MIDIIQLWPPTKKELPFKEGDRVIIDHYAGGKPTFWNGRTGTVIEFFDSKIMRGDGYWSGMYEKMALLGWIDGVEKQCGFRVHQLRKVENNDK